MDHIEDQRIELIGEDGAAILFDHLMTIEHSGVAYLILAPSNPKTPEEDGAVIMRIEKDENGADCYVPEEDEGVIEAVFEQYLAILEEEED